MIDRPLTNIKPVVSQATSSTHKQDLRGKARIRQQKTHNLSESARALAFTPTAQAVLEEPLTISPGSELLVPVDWSGGIPEGSFFADPLGKANEMSLGGIRSATRFQWI